MMKTLEGQLVRILGGQAWEVLKPEGGYAGLEETLREYEGRDVVIIFDEAVYGKESVAVPAEPEAAPAKKKSVKNAPKNAPKKAAKKAAKN